MSAVAASRPAPAWQPDSWQARPALQMPQYPDPVALEQAVAQLASLPPLVTSCPSLRAAPAT